MAKKGLKPKEHQIKIPDGLWQTIGEIAQELFYGDERGGHTGIIHEMISAAAMKWRYSPYVCREAQHLVLVTETGDVFYRLVQNLKLNYEREKLPCTLEMKPEKKDEYAREYDKLPSPNMSRGDWFRSRWIINHFCVWKGSSNSTGETLRCGVDHRGASSKMVDLPLPDLDGSLLTRETVVGLREYVQWKEAKTPKYDRVDLNVDIPTRNFRALVVIDENLYKNLRNEEIHLPDLEFRNREWARFSGRDVVDDVNTMLTPRGRSLTSDEEVVADIKVQLERLLDRLRELARQQVDGHSVVTEEDRDLIESLVVPERFLFFQIDWPSPHFGIEVCVHWEKPIRN